MPDDKDPLTSYRVDQLEVKMQALEKLIDELLLELRATKKAGRWVLAIAVGFGGFLTWLANTLGFHIGGKP